MVYICISTVRLYACTLQYTHKKYWPGALGKAVREKLSVSCNEANTTQYAPSQIVGSPFQAKWDSIPDCQIHSSEEADGQGQEYERSSDLQCVACPTIE